MYAVFGMTKELAHNKAKKTVKAHKKGNIPKSFTEYAEDIKNAENEIFESSRPAQLSTLYSNRSQAQQFIDLAKKHGAKGLHIKKRLQKLDGYGNPELDPKSKKPILFWEAA
jgi:23S rRNA maturation mini-RNase III